MADKQLCSWMRAAVGDHKMQLNCDREVHIPARGRFFGVVTLILIP